MLREMDNEPAVSADDAGELIEEMAHDDGCDDDDGEACKKYWAKIPATVDGLLGGFPQVSVADITGSRRFLTSLWNDKRANVGCHRALDCGAGIGRVTKHLLSELFDKVDLLEQNRDFLDVARNSYLDDKRDRVDRYICAGLQNFSPEIDRYDVIWVQWVLSHMNDHGIKRFLERSKSGLRENGQGSSLLIIKENISGTDEVEEDIHDFTVTRPACLIRDMIEKAGYVIIKEAKQTKFPAGLYEVRMFACRPLVSS